jgi:dihydrofolate synthase / folylpolyglutamate synthase
MKNIVDICDKVFETVEKFDLDVRFFEIVTIIGFLHFMNEKCDYVVLECGIGGRIDATNVV